MDRTRLLSASASLCTNCAGSGYKSDLKQRQRRELPASVFSMLQVGLVWRGQQKVATNQKVGSSNLSGPRHWELRPDSGLKVECYGSTKPEIGAEAASRRKIFSEGAAAPAQAARMRKLQPKLQKARRAA